MHGNLCKNCPEKIKGYCCFLNMDLGIHNIILENVPCPYLDLETKLCKVYSRRDKEAPWCLNIKEGIKKGGLPKGCLYLRNKIIDKPPYPKVFIKDIIDELKPIHIAIYNTINNIPFEDIISLSNEKIQDGI